MRTSPQRWTRSSPVNKLARSRHTWPPHYRHLIMDVADLEAKLAQARKQYKDLWQTSTKTGQSGIIDVSDLDLDDWKAAREAVLSAERALALAQGEEAALACNW